MPECKLLIYDQHGHCSCVRIGNSLSGTFSQANGVPQGSVLSVALFAISINDVGTSLPTSVGRALFVDDFAIWSSSRSVHTVERQLQMAVRKVQDWCNKTGFVMSTSKTTAVHFCRKRSCTDPVIMLNGRHIPFKPAAKFLGVWMDRRLTYTTHINDFTQKCAQRLQVMRTVSRCSYGADRSILLLMYRSLVRSKIDYGCFIYDGAYATSKRRLDVIHGVALRIATGAFRTSPAASVVVGVDEPPLALRRKLLGA